MRKLRDNKLVLDEKDYEILDVICNNARKNILEISKKLNFNKDSVKERINKMVKEKYILDFYPLINYKKLGLKVFHIYIHFISQINEKDKRIFLKELKKNSRVISISEIVGRYDLKIQILAKDNDEADNIGEKIINLVKKNKPKFEVIEVKNLILYSRHLSKRRFAIPFFHNLKEKSCKKNLKSFDNLDCDILHELSNNANRNIIGIAFKLGKSAELIRYRINMLVKNEVILGFFARTNKHRAEINNYILLMELRPFPNLKKLEKLREIENVYEATKLRARWNFSISFYSENNTQLLKTLNALRDLFSEELESLRLLIFLERFLFKPFPKGLDNKKL